MKKKGTAARGLFAWFTSRDRHNATEEGAFLPPDIFEAQLNRERARADRTGSSFVVLTFKVEMDEAHRALTEGVERLLADTLAGELRLCDTKGWHVNGVTTVAAILPNTSENESYTPMRRAESVFRERFKNAFPGMDDTPQLQCGVHAYPCEGSWGRRGLRGVDVPVKLTNEVFTDAGAILASTNGNGHHG